MRQYLAEISALLHGVDLLYQVVLSEIRLVCLKSVDSRRATCESVDIIIEKPLLQNWFTLSNLMARNIGQRYQRVRHVTHATSLQFTGVVECVPVQSF